MGIRYSMNLEELVEVLKEAKKVRTIDYVKPQFHSETGMITAITFSNRKLVHTISVLDIVMGDLSLYETVLMYLKEMQVKSKNIH